MLYGILGWKSTFNHVFVVSCNCFVGLGIERDFSTSVPPRNCQTRQQRSCTAYKERMLWSSRGLVSGNYVQVLICYDAATGICMTQCLDHETSAGNSKWPTQGVCAACTSFSYVSIVESFEDAALSVLCTGKRAESLREACCLNG